MMELPPVRGLVTVLLLAVWMLLGCGDSDSVRGDDDAKEQLRDLEEELEEAKESNESLRSQIGKKKKTLERVENLKAQTSEQEKKKGIIQGLKARKHGPVRMLDEIAKAAPEKLRLLEIDENKGQILLVGRATSNDVIAEFIHNLEQSIYFEEVYINASEQTMEDNVKVKEFSITARLMVVHDSTTGSSAESSYQYDPYGKRDPYTPFLRLVDASTEGGPQTALQRYDLSEYQMVGAIVNVARPRGLVEDPTGAAYTVEVGDYIGKNWGQISEISAEQIVVSEEYQSSDGDLLVTNKVMKLRGGVE